MLFISFNCFIVFFLLCLKTLEEKAIIIYY